MPETGFYWHVHHDVLYEYCYSYSARLRHIRQKPWNEIKRRLKLFKPIRNLPPQLRQLIKAAENENDVDRNGWGKVYKWLNYHRPALAALHKQQCKRCPWTGYTIFPTY
jgi:hypothetical protein